MAKRMIGYGASGTAYDFFAYDAAGAVWNGAAYVAFADVDYATYRIAAVQVGTSGRFVADEPADAKSFEMRVRAGTLAGSTVVASGVLDARVDVRLMNGAAVQPEPADPDDAAVYNGAAVRPFVVAALVQRVSVSVIGDSNTIIFGDTGYYARMGMAWADRCGLWGTGVLPGAPEGGFSVMGTRLGWAGGIVAPTLPPSPWLDYVLPVGMLRRPAYTDVDFTGGGEMVTIVSGSAYVATTEQLRWHQTYFTFATGAGHFTPVVRDQFSATWRYVHPAPVPTNTGANGTAELAIDLPADAARALSIQFADWKFDDAANGVAAPWGVLYQQIERVAATSGVSYNLMNYQGGQSTRDVAITWGATNPDVPAVVPITSVQAGKYFREVTRLQGVPAADAKLMVEVIEGINDAASLLRSVGVNPAPSNTAQGYADNIRRLIALIVGYWVEHGYTAENLFFTLYSPHARAAYDEQFRRMELGLMAVALTTPRVAFVRGSRLATAEELTAKGFYNGVDTAHLNDGGQKYMADLRVQALWDAALAGDVPATSDGTGDVGAGIGQIPINHDGGLDVMVEGVASTPGCLRPERSTDHEELEGVEIIAYTASDYDQGNRRRQDRRGRSVTDELGNWLWPIMLNPGQYVLVMDRSDLDARVVNVEVI